ncbi:primosomal protein N' [Myxococcota bacterium]|nr:primosomal protein N' [Myxococcota bacterium]
MNTRTQAEVILFEKLRALNYQIPDALCDKISVGSIVEVPLGNRKCRGVISKMGLPPNDDDKFEVKDILNQDESAPLLPPSLLELVIFGANYYGVRVGEMLQAALPSLSKSTQIRYILSTEGIKAIHGPARASEKQVLWLVEKKSQGITATSLAKELGIKQANARSRLKRLFEKEWLEQKISRRNKRKLLTAFRRLPDAKDTLSARQDKARSYLKNVSLEGSLASQLAKEDKDAYRKLRILEKAGMVERYTVEEHLHPFTFKKEKEKAFTPTEEQAKAIQEILKPIAAEQFQTFVLQGITGSGKTEVYLQVIGDALKRGKTALMLVPEIALTPQLGKRFRDRFGSDVATFHSGLTPAERRDEWERIARGEARIGLGARSAIFLPLRELGVVIVDEEHETSFKQDETPRYNARDLAIFRGKNENAVVVLGSATPSLESRNNADQERYKLLHMHRRVGERSLPSSQLIDLAEASRVGEGIFSTALAKAVEANLSSGEQTILFLNRRGFAPYVYCQDCGHAWKCDDCDVSLTLHRQRDVLICHYCGHEERSPEVCPSCEGLNLVASGLGTEKLEDELLSLFGSIEISRLDRDRIRRRADLERELSRFGRGETKIMIGTQMVTKGHDFPGVTLVGIISADNSLNFPDFRAAERTFQLLTQVSGRAGRGERSGSVLIQAYEGEHYAIKHAMKHDYEGFVEQELAYRKELLYPPFAHLALIRLESPELDTLNQHAEMIAEALMDRAKNINGVYILGPAPSPLARLKGAWRIQILIKAESRSLLRKLLAGGWKPKHNNSIKLILDVDPQSML